MPPANQKRHNYYPVTEEISFDEVMREKLAQFQETWQAQQIQCRAEIDESPLKMNRDLVDIMLNNLLSNATTHNLPKGVISVKLSPHRLIVMNTGVNEPLEKEKLFRRFGRKRLSNEGTGLGLSIVRQICEAGRMRVDYQFLRDNQHAFIVT